MRVIICDLAGELPRAHRQDLEARLAALGSGLPGLDAVEIDLETAGATPASPRRRARVTLRAGKRRIVRVSHAEPTLADALDEAMSRAARAREALEAQLAISDPRGQEG